MKKNIIALDLDGTLLNEDYVIDDGNLFAIEEAYNADYLIVPVTGRPLKMIPYQLEGSKYIQYIITSNGACVFDLFKNEEIYSKKLDNKIALKLLKILKKYEKIGITIHLDHTYYLEGKWLFDLGTKIFKNDSRNFVLSNDLIKLLEETKKDIGEIQVYFFDENIRVKLMEEIMNYNDEFNYSIGSTYFEMYNKDTNKGAALEFLKNYLGTTRDNLYCFGDSLNDLSMFNVCGHKFAMGNAVKEIKELATHIVSNNSECGVKEGIDIILKGEC